MRSIRSYFFLIVLSMPIALASIPQLPKQGKSKYKSGDKIEFAGVVIHLPDDSVLDANMDSNHTRLAVYPLIGDDFLMILRKVPLEFRDEMIEKYATEFMGNAVYKKSTRNVSGKQVHTWYAKKVISGNPVESIVYFLPDKESFLTFWVSWKEDSKHRKAFFEKEEFIFLKK